MSVVNFDSKTTCVYDRNKNSKAKIVINRGGARASKSFSIEQELLLNRFITEEKKQILVVRKTLPSLKLSAHKVWKDWLVDFGMLGKIKEEKQSLNYYYGNNYLHFGGLDDPIKIQSTEWNYIWMQEATDFDYEDYKILKLRLSAPSKDGRRNQLFMCFNPIDEYHWIKTQVIDKNVDDFEEIHSTYKDNPFLTEDYIRSEILSLKEQDINFYNIFALGEWGKLSSLIFNNWCVVDEFPEDIDVNNSSYGLDFGAIVPTALCENRIKDDKLFVKEHIYDIIPTNSDLIKKLHQIIPIDKKQITIYADSAEPDRIEEIAREGFRIEAAEKSVLSEIDFLKRRKINIEKNSSNLFKEIKGYSWRVDKQGRTIQEPVKYNDHLMSALRYGVYGKFKNRYGSARIRWI